MNDTQKKKTGGSCAPIRNASFVCSDTSWSVSIELTVVYRQAERRRAAQILLYTYCLATPIGYFYNMAHVKIMHDKPVFRLSLQLARVAAWGSLRLASIILSYEPSISLHVQTQRA